MGGAGGAAFVAGALPHRWVAVRSAQVRQASPDAGGWLSVFKDSSFPCKTRQNWDDTWSTLSQFLICRTPDAGSVTEW